MRRWYKFSFAKLARERQLNPDLYNSYSEALLVLFG